MTSQEQKKSIHTENIKKATFAGGCFWCVEKAFETMEGIDKVISGYSGGLTKNPSYAEVTSGQSGHYEAIQIYYDPDIINYPQLVDLFWRNIDPTDAIGQFADKGPHYRTAIFYHNDSQLQVAKESKKRLENSGIFDKPILTDIIKFDHFYEAEDYHQDYYKKNPLNYDRYYRYSGRKSFFKNIWSKVKDYTELSDYSKKSNLDKKSEKQNSSKNIDNLSKTSLLDDGRNMTYKRPDDSQIKSTLTDLQYEVTQKDGTEAPFDNVYWSHKEEGIYVDIVSGEPLFSSKDKYKSGTGWPSFTRAINSFYLIEHVDRKFGIKRVELRSKFANSHLGHLFNDGPKPTGQRYCINSSSLRFVKKEKMKTEGYNDYLKLFD